MFKFKSFTGSGKLVKDRICSYDSETYIDYYKESGIVNFYFKEVLYSRVCSIWSAKEPNG